MRIAKLVAVTADYYGRLRQVVPGKIRYLTWKASELTEAPDAALDPDWWIDETTTRSEYNTRMRRHAYKNRDDYK